MRPVMTGGLLKKAGPVDNRAAFFIFRSKNEASDPCKRNGRRTHGTGLKGDVKITSIKSIVGFSRTSCAQHHNFRMSRRVMCPDRRVTRLRQNFARLGMYDKRTNRNFAAGSGGSGLLKGTPHQGVFGHRHGSAP